MDLTTTYMGMTLRSPLVGSASPLWESIDNIRRAEEAGAGAVVLFSLFEEQIRRERESLYHSLDFTRDSHVEAQSYFPEPQQYHVGTEGYLKLISSAKKAVKIPIIASLNGTSLGGWISFARRMEEAGADGIELNIYNIPTDTMQTGAEVEQTYLEIVAAVKDAVRVPVAVKLSPYFSNIAYMARRLDAVGADALVMFNRFYQPDIDLDNLEVTPNVILSTPQALRLPLTWIGILYSKLKASLAATSGVHSGRDAVKLILAGADVTMLTSALLKHGIDHLRTVENELRDWMMEHEYESVKQMRGAVSQVNSTDPSAFERAQYMRALITYRSV
jgi:dihydroorotate dehydrogenase (fumarate)